MDYTGEHLLPGLLGHFFITLSVVASLVATFSFFKAARSKNEIDGAYWKRLARGAFLAEVISVFAIFGILFYIISNHLFEYKYAWQHSSRSLETKYLLSCFWEGQEGSFLLWSIWHCVLGLILIRRSRQWEAPVMTVVSFAQFCIATMIAGFYFFNWKMGSNPFVLLRNEGILDGAPALHENFNASLPLAKDYLTRIHDGNDLNPLLQNYWMVIHPPILFLGFASTVVPFAYAIAGLWTKKFGDWVRPALPWALFSAAVLGTGIMMGGAWAYESLSFGGYWAWDPVENASLVPWLTLIAGIHAMLIYKHTGHSLRATHFLLLMAFSLVLYSTFLTRSGILGDTSVHAFTDLGMNIQLLGFLLIFVVPSFTFYISRYKNIPHINKEELTSSREFWMFIGSLVFFLTAGFVTVGTSLPVINKIFGSKFSMGEDPVFAYNRIIVFVAVIIGLLTAMIQYLKYKQTGGKFFWSKIIWPTVLSLIIGGLVVAFGNIDYQEHGMGFLAAIWLAVVCSIYAVIANAAYIWLGMKGKLKLSGGSISHMGFGLLLLGILISSSRKEVVSLNTNGIYVPLGENSKEKPGENLTLIKGVPATMADYTVTYERDSANPKKPLWYYQIDFKNKNGKEHFSLHPNEFVNYKGNEGLMANPDAKHYWDHDIFTYILSLPNPDKNQDTASFRQKILKRGDTAFYSGGYYILEDVTTQDHIPTGGLAPDDKVSVATIKVVSKNNQTYTVKPILIEKDRTPLPMRDSVIVENLFFELRKVEPAQVELGVKESNTVLPYVTLKAYKFPFINLVWLGVIIMVTGIIISMVRRIRLNAAGAEVDNLRF
jgi:cytochrome c-type biogenesis protein CcmF